MTFPHHIWNQLKNLSADELIAALERDGWIRDRRRGAQLVYRHPDRRRVSVHYHPGKTFGPKLLRALLADTRWTVPDMRRLKLVK